MLVAPHQPQLPQAHLDLTQERWERMSVLFQGIREHARNFEFPAPSVAALESVLIRLYLEAPVINGGMFLVSKTNCTLTSTTQGL